jgi:6-phosphogluconolactonase
MASTPTPREVLPGVLVFPQPADVARAAAERFVADTLAALSEGESFCVALSGGSTPKEMYRLLASPEFQREIDWDRVKLFWSDERCVPPDHPDSNYGMAKTALLDAISIPSTNVFRMPADRADLEAAAGEYAQQLRDTLPLDVYGVPRFDLILLGLGPDGHTASLFPGTPVIEETRKLVAAPLVPKFGSRRMTFTYPLLNAGKEILFLATGAEKAEPLAAVVRRTANPPLPAARIEPRDGKKFFFVDTAAAALLAPNVSGSER